MRHSFVDLSQLLHLCHLRHSRFCHLSQLQALCDVVERPAGILFSDKMMSPEIVDMHVV